MRLVLAIQCFFAVLFGRTVPARALPAPPPPEESPAAKAERARLEQELGEVRRQLEQARAALTTLEQELGALKPEKTRLEQAAGEAGKAREAAEGKLSQLEARLEEARQAEKAALDKLKQARDDGALALLAWMQREGRLIDFLMETIDAYSDDQVGAAVRAIHAGCRKVVDEGLELAPIMPGAEESRVEVPAGFDPVAIQLSGKVQGQPPFKGTLKHHGWRTTRVAVPVPETVDTAVLAPAEVEL